jgi:hypothetical protein
LIEHVLAVDTLFVIVTALQDGCEYLQYELYVLYFGVVLLPEFKELEQFQEHVLSVQEEVTLLYLHVLLEHLIHVP